MRKDSFPYFFCSPCKRECFQLFAPSEKEKVFAKKKEKRKQEKSKLEIIRKK